MHDARNGARSQLTGELLSQRLSLADIDRRWPNVRPRDAATLIVIDFARKKPKVLMGRRHTRHTFIPGLFVFPGGSVETTDRNMSAAGSLLTRTEDALAAKVSRPSASRGRFLALAAIRETFEETGYLIGSKDYGPPEIAPEGPWRTFQERGVFPDLEALHFVARAITPPRLARRFDTRFFAVDRRMVVDEVPGHVGPDSELTELVWVGLDEARKLPLPAITLTIIDELDNRIAQGFSPILPIPFYYERNRHILRELL